MTSENSATSTESMTALFHQYRAAMNMLSQTNIRRTATARFYISLISGLVGLLAIVHRMGVDVETQLWVTVILTLFSVFLNATWFMMIRSLRHLAKIQRSLLKEMEESLPYAFISRQELLLEQSSGWLITGKIEQRLPLAMMLPAVLILLFSYLR